jgi:hypothetical protein
MLDKFTEIFAHMVGIFHTTTEAERMRDAYAEFKFNQINSELNDLEISNVPFTLRYTLKGFDPELKYTPPPFDQPLRSWAPDVFPAELPALYVSGGGGAPLEYYFEQGYFPFFSLPTPPLLTLEPPGSVVIITAQSAWLHDSDLFRMSGVYAQFEDPSVYAAALDALYEGAQRLGVLTQQSALSFNEDGSGSFVPLHDLMAETDATSRIGETVSVLHGLEAYGMFVNGEAVEVSPLLDDLMPELLRAEDAPPNDDGEQAKRADTNESDLSQESIAEAPDSGIEDTDPFAGLNPPSPEAEFFSVDDGHHVVTGGNMMINETSMHVSWLDAPVISVMGNLVALDLVSQVNVLGEHATIGGVVQDSSSATFNVAMMSYSSSQPIPTETEGQGPADADGHAEDIYTGLPKNWAVTRIEGDLLTVNWVQQYSFMTDNDRADIQITGSNSYIGLGGNHVVNLTSLAEVGYGYDLIMVGGDLITVNQIHQMNVMLDHDTLIAEGAVSFGDTVSGNLLFNGASISTVGLNTYSPMTENFAAASKAFAEGAQTIGKEVAHDSVFAGDDLLTVLYIEGDFKTINWVEQTNVMADNDQVHLALASFNAQAGAAAELYMGSNAEINSAAISNYGVDSEVRVGGEVYSDALLYQAELIDADCDPTGVAMPSLASEAVLFLADGMISDPSHGSDDPGIIPTPSESLSTPDLMQTMLA